MISEQQQKYLLNWFKRNTVVAILIISLGANGVLGWAFYKKDQQLTTANKAAAAFYESVYKKETERSETWEKIFQKERAPQQ